MTEEQTTSFLSAVEAAEITKYSFDVDDGTKIINDGERSFVKNVNGCIVGVTRSNFGGSHTGYGQGGVSIVTSDCLDCHKARVVTDYEHAKTFLENFGADLTDDDLKIMLQIDGKNVELKPITGDYVNVFHYLSKKQYDELSPEEKEAYDASKKEYEEAKEKYLGENQAASITVW